MRSTLKVSAGKPSVCSTFTSAAPRTPPLAMVALALLIVVPKPGAALCETQVRDHLSTRVAKWWLPDKVIFADSLPHTATGKLLKTALRTQYADVELSS